MALPEKHVVKNVKQKSLRRVSMWKLRHGALLIFKPFRRTTPRIPPLEQSVKYFSRHQSYNLKVYKDLAHGIRQILPCAFELLPIYPETLQQES